MRPLVLTISAFGPYAGTQSIDFAELQGRNFFLIHGPTGAGKTTILDAICFALYGDTSGNYRDGRSMRSDHADPAACTEILFDFSVGTAAYRIRRVPEQVRRKKRGDGTTIQTAEATLWSLSPSGETAVIISGWSKVTEKIEQILNFKSGQFRQVVLLPQGDFRKLLLADSKERQEILQVLFKTEMYQALEEAFKQKTQGLNKSFEELNKEYRWILQEAGMQTVEELEAAHVKNQSEAELLTELCADVQGQLNQAQEQLNQGNIILAKMHEQDQARQALADLQAQAIAVDRDRVELVQAQRAAGLLDLEKILNQLDTDVEAAQSQRAACIKELETAGQELAAARAQLVLEQEQAGEREQLGRKIILLQELLGKAENLADDRLALQNRAAEKGAAFQLWQEALLNQQALQQQLETGAIEYQQVMQAATQINAQQAALEQWRQIAEKQQLWEELRLQGQAAAAQVEHLTGETAQKTEAYHAANRNYLQIQQRWVEGQAAVLAANLSAGTPCPVCGGLDHPAKAVGAGDVPSENDVRELRGLAEQLDTEKQQIALQLIAAQKDRDNIDGRINELAAELGAHVYRTRAEILDDVLDAEACYHTAVAAGERLTVLEAELADGKIRERELSDQVKGLEEQYRLAESACLAVETLLKERQSLIPTEYHDTNLLQQDINTAEARLKAAKDKYETAQNQAEQWEKQISGSQVAVEHADDRYNTSLARLQAEQRSFAERLVEAGFLAVEDYAQAQRPVTQIRDLDERIKKFDSSLLAAKERVLRAEAAARGLQAPDLQALQDSLTQVQEQQKVLIQKQTILTSLLQRQTAYLAKLAQLQNELVAIETQYGLIGRLSEVANGRNEYGLTFQRFVLGALLDDVVIAANERLKMMSRGRYYLQRTMDRARKNAAGGLDLEVFDNYTGIARGVSTLSGGETFLASLSLALGLADVVQAYAGGIHLDAIFVDEGFGTLDPETLDFALRALIDLQRGGRMVGIISHVPELRERIDACLEIKTTDRGSAASFRIN